MNRSGLTLIFVVSICVSVRLSAQHAANLNPRIVGGRPANKSEFPYIVSIRRTEFEELFGYGNHVCGGTIVDKNTVITAAHCLFDSHDNFLGNSESFTVVAGANVLKPKLLNSQVRKVSRIFVHPDYESETLEHDIAVLKLKSPLKLNGKTVTSLALQQKELSVGTRCSTHGWGYQSYNSGILSNDLLTIDIPIYDHQSCARAYDKLNVEVFNTTICAGVASGELDTCNGDSGGPLVCNNTLAGIVSFGNECAVANFPGIYTKISDYLDYIEDPARFNGTFVVYCFNSAAKVPSFLWLPFVFVLISIIKL